ncbi:MAG: hypothetical protein JXB49_29250 [Bacteroidales bacterium]|nr:hypothetical protein [Bacteroidales bacterium]
MVVTKGFLISFLLLFSDTIIAQQASVQSQYKIHKITVEDGLSHNRVNSIIRDKDGFIWFATNEGLNRYDGYDFRIYNHTIGDTLTINHNIVRDILNDRRGRLWIASDSGLNRYLPQYDAFINIQTVDKRPIGIVWDIMEDESGTIWIGTTDGIWYFDTLSDTPKRLDILTAPLRNIGVLKIIEDSKNRIWLATTTNGLFLFKRNTNEVVNYMFDESDVHSISQNRVETIFEDKEGRIWIGTGDNGLNIYNENKNDFNRVIVDKDNPTSGRVRAIIEDSQGRLWLGTKSGLYLRKTGTDYEFYRYAYADQGYSELSQNSIYDIYIDNNDIMWIGTFLGGVNYIDLNEKRFIHYFAKDNDDRFLNSNIVFSIFEDSKKNLWIGTEDGGANYLNRQTGRFAYFMHDPDNSNTISSNNVKTFAEDRNGNIWIGTYQGSLDRYNPRTKQFTHFLHDPDDSASIINSRVYILKIDSKGDLWIGTGKGLDLLRLGSTHFFHFNDKNDTYGLPRDVILVVFEDKDSTMWIGTLVNGLFYYDIKQNKFIPYKENIIIKSVQSVCEDFLGHLWIGGDQGVFCINRETGKVFNYNREDGLLSDRVYRVINDTMGNIWISSTKGLTKFINGVYRPDSINFKNYTKEDGLQSSIFIPNSYIKSKSGELFFGGINGFNAFFPDQIKDNPFIPQVKITGLKIFNREVGVNQEIEGKVVLTKVINATDAIELSYRHRVFTIEFAALHFIQPNLNQYRYKLENFDKDWIDTDADRRFATYTNLPGGDYIFKVIASNNDGLWNEVPVELRIKILPPYWQTWWFRIVVALGVLAIFFTIFILRIRSLNRQKTLLEEKVEERTKDLYEANIQLKEQAEALNSTNTQLEERQMQVEEQAEELETQKNELERTQGKILEQAAELEVSNIHLRQLNSTKDKFFSIIAHDLKNPFQSIMGFVGLLKLKYDELAEEKKRKYIDLAYSSTMSIYQLLENLLTWSRSQLNTITFKRSQINLKEIIEDSMNFISQNIVGKEVEFKVNCQDSVIVFVDDNMIKTILRNLLSNAYKYTDSGGIISVTCLNKEGYVEISVADTGIGMSTDDVDMLFKIDVSFTKPGIQGEKGTGLGLMLCKEFVEKHGGKIWVESQPGKGSKFSFTIPNKTM